MKSAPIECTPAGPEEPDQERITLQVVSEDFRGLRRALVGRTDLWGGDTGAILKSIRSRILTLPDETRVICGHGPDTTVGDEKRWNPFVGQGNR